MPLSDEEIGLSGRGSTSKLLSDADIGLEPNDYIQSLRKQVASSPDLGFVSGYKRELGDLWNTINMHLMGSDQTPTNMAPAAANWLLKQATTPANYMLGVGLKNVVSPIAKRVVAGALAAQGIKGLNEVLGANTPPQQGPIAPMFGMSGTPIGSWAGGTPIGIPGAEGAVAQLLGPQTIPEYPQPFPPKENVGTKGQQTEELLDTLASGGMALGGHMAAVRLPRELYNENAEPFFGGGKPTRVLSDSDIGLLPASSDIQPTALLPRFAETGQTGMTQPSSGQQITMMPPNRFAVDAKGQVADLSQLSPNELVELMRGPKVYKAPEARVPAEPPELSPSEKKTVEAQPPQPREGPGGGRYKPFKYEPDLPARSTYFSGMPLEAFYEKERELRGPFALTGPQKVLSEDIGKGSPQQVLGRLQNTLHPDEMEWYRQQGLEKEVEKGGRSSEELARWMQENGPRVEVRKVGEGSTTPDQKEFRQVEHQLDTQYPNWRQKETELSLASNEFNSLILKYNELERKIAADPNRARSEAHWASIAPKPESDMPGYVEGAVTVPYDNDRSDIPENRAPEFGGKTNAQRGILFPSSHSFPPNTLGFFRGYMEQRPDGGKTFHVIEVQSDWAQQRRSEQELAKQRNAESPFTFESQTKDHPLLKHYERLALKAAIEHARAEGADRIAVSDAETAMMTEGHDLAAVQVGYDPDYPEEWEAHLANIKIPQEQGMRLHYDRTLPKIAEELTGEKGERVEFGEHKGAFEGYPEGGQFRTQKGRQQQMRKDLIFRNPSGTPKTTISAREFPLNKTAEAKRPFSLFGRDKLSSRLYSGTPIEPLEHEDFPIPLGRLRPAINLGNQLLIGERGESHDQILERNKPILEKYGLTPSDIPHHDDARGFTMEGNTHPAGFLSRKAASYITGVPGTAKAGGLDSQDIPPKFSQQSTKEQANAIRELRTDSISQAQPPSGIQPLEEEIRRGAGEQGAARKGEGQKQGEEELQKRPSTSRRANVGRGVDDRQASYLYSGLPLDHSTFTKSAKDLLSSAIAGHWNRERMVQLLDAADNMAKTPEQKKENRRVWLEQLNQIKMPDGKPLVAKRGKGKEAPEGFEGRNYQGAHVWVNKEVADLFDTLTGESFVRKRALGRAALRVEEELKHKLLAFDSYHAFRIARKTLFQTGKLPSADHLSLLEKTPEEVQAQFDRNEISKEALDFHKENYKDVQFLLKNGLNVKLWDENPDVRRLFENEVKIGGVNINPLSYGQKFNSWVFNKLSRSAMLQVGLYELERARKAHPEWTQEQLGSHVAKQTNIYMGNLGRQGFFKSQGMKDLMQVVFLAPSWVEALAQSEGRAAKQFAQIPVDLARGKGLNVGTQAKGIGAGIAAYVVANQIINMATKGHPTWENDEPGRKFDAFIPDITGKGPGFWLSPFSDMAETTHDYLRYAHKGYGPLESTGKIIENKLSPIGRAEEALRIGRDYAGRKLDESERVNTAVKSLIPTPLPLAGELSETPGSEQRQIYSSFGLKVEPAGRHEDIGSKTLQQRVEQVRKEKSQQKISSAGKVTATEESVYHDQERAKEVTSSLSRADRNWMESRGMSVPGFANNVRVEGVNVPFSEEETKRMTEMVKEETKRIITTLRSDPKFTEISQARQQEVFNTRVRIAARTARDRVVQDMGKGQGSHAQNLGKTNGGFRILQPQTQ